MKNGSDYSQRRRETRKTSIDIVPLIDVIFLLLCFFVLMTIQMVMQKGMPVNLAEANQGRDMKQQKAPVVSIRKDGSVYFDEEKLSLKALEQRLNRLKQKKSDQKILLNVDRSVQHGSVIDVADLIRKVGIENVIFNVEPTS